jgi:methyl-accepting chemotaxis protein
VTAQERELLLLLIAIFAVFSVVTIGSIYLVVKGAMRPVLALTGIAEQVSMGEALERPIKPATTDEVGQLTKAIDRLRVSMRAAMSRLGH